MKDIKSIPAKISTLLRRFHVVMFIVAVVIGLTIAVLLLNGIVTKTTNVSPPSQNSSANSFDQATIDRVNELKKSSEDNEPLDFSKGRISPFSE